MFIFFFNIITKIQFVKKQLFIFLETNYFFFLFLFFINFFSYFFYFFNIVSYSEYYYILFSTKNFILNSRFQKINQIFNNFYKTNFTFKSSYYIGS